MPAWCFGMTNAQTFIDSHRDELRSAPCIGHHAHDR